MQSFKARILVTGPVQGGWAMWISTRFQVWLAGGRAIRFRTIDYVPGQLPEFDALILGGGEDVDPSFYKEPLRERLKTVAPGLASKIYSYHEAGKGLLKKLFRIIPHTGRTDRYRDEMELALLKAAVTQQKPVLGVCRGIQLINVYFGGTIHQDISHFYKDQKKITSVFPRKEIKILNGSFLNRLVHMERFRANGLHSQAVNRLGEHLKAVAWETVGIVQSIEAVGLPSPVVGVQWHPEFLFYKRDQRLLFQWLISKTVAAKDSSVNPGLRSDIVSGIV